MEMSAVRNRRRPKSSGYKVGYGRPPTETRFAPGKSGNPKGRPKGTRSAGAILRDIIQQKIAVSENGKTRRISVLEITFRRLANDAMRSDPNAIKLLLSLVDRYADTSESQPQLDDLLAEDRIILTQYLQEAAASGSAKPAENGRRRNER
jgi:Family of unknown function (DUF5681)